jgi:hypothetical protein
MEINRPPKGVAIIVHVILWIHVGSAITGFLLSGIVSFWVFRHARGRDLVPAFWIWQRITQWLTVVLGAAGTGLYLLGRRPSAPLHLLYGALAILAIILLGAFGPKRDPGALLEGWQVNPAWILFGLNVFLWAMYGRGLTTGFFGF